MANTLGNLSTPFWPDKNGEMEASHLILIVDDVPANIQVISALLRKERYEVQELSDPKQAIQFVQEFMPDLILLDIQMPDISGIELCQTMKANPKIASIPIIFLTALDDPKDKINGLNVGGFDYITKPFYLHEVLLRVRNCLLIHDLKNALEDKNRMLKEALTINKESLSYFQEERYKASEQATQRDQLLMELSQQQQRSLESISEASKALAQLHRGAPESLEHIQTIQQHSEYLLSLLNAFSKGIEGEE